MRLGMTNRICGIVCMAVVVTGAAGCGGSASDSNRSTDVGTKALLDFSLCDSKKDQQLDREDEAAFARAAVDRAFEEKEQRRFERTELPTPEERFDAAVELCSSRNLLLSVEGDHQIAHEEAEAYVEEACAVYHEDKQAVLQNLAKTFHGKALFPRMREFTDLCYRPNG